MASASPRVLRLALSSTQRGVTPIAIGEAAPITTRASLRSRQSPISLLAATTSTASRGPDSRRSISTTRAMGIPSGSGKFSYGVAASYIAKDHPYDPSTHVFHFNPYNRVHPTRGGSSSSGGSGGKIKKSKAARPESGQDAFFVSRLGDSAHDVALGVADGVGGWMESGVDPADFSHAFCDYMAAAASAAGGTRLSARQVMQQGYDAVCHDGTILAGGSTAVVGLLSGSGTLEAANLGDSGFAHFRLGAVHATSEPQTHAFNTPYQLSVVPPAVAQRMAAFGGAQLHDLPRDAEVTRHALQHGDVLVFASDGLWDNLFDQDLLRIVSRGMAGAGAWRGAADAEGISVVPDLAPYTRLQETEPEPEGAAEKLTAGQRQRAPVSLQSFLATEIVAAAKAASVNQKQDGPFAKEVKKYFPQENWHGGKVDDICVIVAIVSEALEAPVKARL